MKISFLFLFFLMSGEAFCQDRSGAQIYDVAQQMPEYPGGEDSMWRFINANIQYPDSAVRHNIQGRIVVGFVVNEDGSISDIKIRKGLSWDIDSEGIRVIKLFPRFTPGKQDGKAVKVRFNLPMSFKVKPIPIDTVRDFKVVEHMPEFPGGEDAMMKFIQKNIQYPDLERDMDIQGRVVLGFIVNEDGSLSDIKVRKSVSPSIDAEAIRVVKLFPKFKPGTQQGKPVRVQFTLPVMFKLATDVLGGQEKERSSYPLQRDIPGVYDKVTVMPEYPGGKDKLLDFLQKNVVYPEDAQVVNIEGVVVVSFVVNEDGSLSDFAIAQEAYSSLNIEALRVAKLLPAFKPGLEDGKPVKVRYRLPISFQLKDYVYNNPYKNDTTVLREIELARSKVVYPKKAIENNIQGEVRVVFCINEDGAVSDIKISKSVHHLLDAEALRVARLLPKFKPFRDPRKALRKTRWSNGTDAQPYIVKYCFEFSVDFKLHDWSDSMKTAMANDQGIYTVHNLPTNTERSDFAPSFYTQGQIFLCSSIQNAKGSEFLRVYIGKPDSDGNIAVAKMIPPYSSEEPYFEGPITYSEKSGEIYVVCSNKKKIIKGLISTNLYRMTYDTLQNKWINQITDAIPFNSDKYYVQHPTLTPDGQTLYFCSDMPGGYGGADIYRSVKNEQGKWTAPVNLGPIINTAWDELFPFIAEDGTLYFASKGHSGLGGLDVFSSMQTRDGWSIPRNLGAPINTSSDDFAYIIDGNNQKGFFSSNRPGGKGDDDIYQFVRKNDDMDTTMESPEFPGGEDAMMLFIQKNIQYPDDARETDIQGRVVVGFVVTEDGSIADIKIKKSVCPSIDAEAIRIVKLFPKFKPGSIGGKPARIEFTLPIMFKLANK